MDGLEQIFFFDAYGNALNEATKNAATTLLYSGEQFDSRINQQYLRARYYNAQTGHFNRLDPFFGNTDDPQSFHKYLYVHADPISGVDPTGLAKNFPALLGTSIHKEYSKYYRQSHPNSKITFGTQLPGVAGKILPDVVDYTLGEIGEIKPLSPYGFATGELQLRAAIEIANGLSTSYNGETIKIPKLPNGSGRPWQASTWQPGVKMLVPQETLFANWIAVTVANADGVLYYKAIHTGRGRPKVDFALRPAIETKLVPIIQPIQEKLRRGGVFEPTDGIILNYVVDALYYTTAATAAGIGGKILTNKINTARLQTATGLSGGIGGLMGAF